MVRLSWSIDITDHIVVRDISAIAELLVWWPSVCMCVTWQHFCWHWWGLINRCYSVWSTTSYVWRYVLRCMNVTSVGQCLHVLVAKADIVFNVTESTNQKVVLGTYLVVWSGPPCKWLWVFWQSVTCLLHQVSKSGALAEFGQIYRCQSVSRSQWRGRCMHRPAPSDGEHQETTWSHLPARGKNVTQHSSSPSTETTGRGISR